MLSNCAQLNILCSSIASPDINDQATLLTYLQIMEVQQALERCYASYDVTTTKCYFYVLIMP